MRKKMGESLILKQFGGMVSNFEDVNKNRRSNWVSNFEISSCRSIEFLLYPRWI
jgi:hypothetical protein